jgi:hypothetical protein
MMEKLKRISASYSAGFSLSSMRETMLMTASLKKVEKQLTELRLKPSLNLTYKSISLVARKWCSPQFDVGVRIAFDSI